jgi:hypothetical protein
MKRTLFFAMGILFTIFNYAQAPQGFNYQAIIRNTEGQPLSAQTVGIRISIQSEGGAPLHYVETHSAVTSQQGAVSLVVGNGTIVSGVFADIPWNEGNIYIKVEVDPSGGNTYSQLGTTKLNAVPYSLFAASGNTGPQGEQGPQGEPGPQGEQGPQGDIGAIGLSAYQIWINYGNEGTIEEFLESLIGETGEQGISAYDIWISLGNEGTVEEFIQSLKGETGTNGANGLSAFEIWLTLGNTGNEEEFIASLKGDPGEDGEDGEDGVGIVSTVENGDGTFTINYSDASYFTTINLTGPAGLNGKTVLSGAGAPTAGVGFDGDFYINTTNSTIYGPKTTGDWGTATSLVGPKGDTGTGLTNKGNWLTGTTYDPGDYVFYCSNAECLTTSMWIVEAAEPFESTTAPYLDPSKWVEFTAPAGPQGPEGPAGPLVSGAVNQILRNAAGGTTWEPTSNVYVTATNVGVGTTSTPAKLTIWGASAAPSIPSATSSAILRIGNTSYSTEGIDIGHMNSSPWAGWIQVGDNNFAEPLSLQPLGSNVGIATTAPTQKLDVNGQIRIRGGSPGLGKVLVSDATGVASWSTALPTHDHSTADLTSGTLTIARGGTGQSTLTQNKVLVGNGTTGILQPTNLHWDNTNSRLGIGTDAPSQQLDMTGQIRIRGGSPGTGKVLTATDATGLASWQTAPEGSKWTLSGSNIYRSTGLVGIGTTAPARTLEVVGGATGVETILMQVRSNFNTTSTQSTFRFVNSSSSTATIGSEISSIRTNLPTAGSSDLLFRTSLGSVITERMRITASGNVGVGTTTPASKLVVSGGDPTETEPIFAVRNNNGKLVFGVYQTGVRIYVDDTQSKTDKAGFAIGGLTGQKEGELEYLRVTPDSVRILLREPTGKTNKAGFAIGGLTGPKSSASLMHLTPENYFIGHESGINVTALGLYNSTLGYMAGNALTNGTSNILIGYESGLVNTTGSYNTFLGYQAGRGHLTSKLTGSNNVFLGYQTGLTTSSGASNVFIGNMAGKDNTTGSSNVFIGNGSGQTNQVGLFNSFLGYQAGYTNKASYNSMMGYQAGYLNNDGTSNVFIGYQSGYNNKSGSNNTYLGHWAGYSYWAGTFGTGSSNVFIGDSTGYKNSSGSDNVFIGSRVGPANLSGEKNVYIGYKAGFKNNSYSNVLIGWEAGANLQAGYDNVYIGYKTGHAGHGQYNVYIGHEAGAANAGGSLNTFVGKSAGKSHQTGGHNVYIGIQSAYNKTSGNYNTFVGPNTGSYNYKGDNNVFIGYEAGRDEAGSNTLYIANNYSPLIFGFFQSDYNNYDTLRSVVIDGKNSYGYKFYVTGRAGGAYNWNSLSDVKFKRNIKPIESALQKTLKLNGVNFEWIEDEEFEKGLQLGFIAQDVEKIIPEVVHNFHGRYSMQYGPVTALLVEAIKEQQHIIDRQQDEINELKNKSDQIEKLMAELEAIKTILNK